MRKAGGFVTDQCGIRGVSLQNPAVNPCRDAGHPASSRARAGFWPGKPGRSRDPRRCASIRTPRRIRRPKRGWGTAERKGWCGERDGRFFHHEGTKKTRRGPVRSAVAREATVPPSLRPVVKANGPSMPCRRHDRLRRAYHPSSGAEEIEADNHHLVADLNGLGFPHALAP